MSFSKTVSVFAALASIFAAGAAGWKLANENQSQPVEQTKDVSAFEEKINDLEKQLEEVKEQPKPETVANPDSQGPVDPHELGGVINHDRFGSREIKRQENAPDITSQFTRYQERHQPVEKKPRKDYVYEAIYSSLLSVLAK